MTPNLEILNHALPRIKFSVPSTNILALHKLTRSPLKDFHKRRRKFVISWDEEKVVVAIKTSTIKYMQDFPTVSPAIFPSLNFQIQRWRMNSGPNADFNMM
jgi:hypothetical protein